MRAVPEEKTEVKHLHVELSTGIPDTRLYRESFCNSLPKGLRNWLLITSTTVATIWFDFRISLGRRHLFGLEVAGTKPYLL